MTIYNLYDRNEGNYRFGQDSNGITLLGGDGVAQEDCGIPRDWKEFKFIIPTVFSNGQAPFLQNTYWHRWTKEEA